MLVFTWMDRERRYFVCSGSSMSDEEPIIRRRLRQESEEINAEPESLNLFINQPKACELHYTCCTMVDRYNRCTQANLKLEIKLVTQDWVKRINISLFSICIVDTRLVYSGILGSIYECQNEFYGYLVQELIDNTYDNKEEDHDR